MVKRLAVFVEGQTEQIFMQKLLVAVAGSHNITVNVIKAKGKGTSRAITLQGQSPTHAPYYALICDCGADNRVASDIRDSYEGLVTAGYHLVLGLRDVYPLSNDKIPDMQKSIAKIMPSGPIPVHLILAVREIEAWFIVEDEHYPNIHPELTSALIKERLGLDTATVAAEGIAAPAETLHAVYQLLGRAYHKNRKHVQRTVDALNYSRLDTELSARVAALGELCGRVDEFFT